MIHPSTYKFINPKDTWRQNRYQLNILYLGRYRLDCDTFDNINNDHLIFHTMRIPLKTLTMIITYSKGTMRCCSLGRNTASSPISIERS